MDSFFIRYDIGRVHKRPKDIEERSLMDTQKLNLIETENFFCPIGTEMILQVENNETQLKGFLVGMDRNKFLILKTPMNSEAEELFKTKRSVKGIFLHEGTIFGYVAKVLGAVTSPAPLFFLSFPDTMEKHELRKNRRIDCSIPVGIHKEDNTDYMGIITDLSSDGCSVTVGDNTRQLSSNVEIDSVLKLSCEMLGIPKDRAVHCIVKNQSQDSKKLHIGFQFDTADADILEKIQSYVNRVLGVIY